MNQVPKIIGTQKFHRKSQKFQEKHYFVFSKRSVTSMRKCPIVQHIESDSGHSTKWPKEGGTTRICKAMKYNSFPPCVFVDAVNTLYY